MNHDREPLTPEERALAERLARTAPRGEPSPDVDAAILAAARTAAATRSGAGSGRRRRWPAVAGVAASLALAVGIAWQLRPPPDQPVPVVDEVPPPAAPAARRAQALAIEPAPDAEPPARVAAPDPHPPQPLASPAPAAAAEQAASSPPAETPEATGAAPAPGMPQSREADETDEAARLEATRKADDQRASMRLADLPPPPPAPPASPSAARAADGAAPESAATAPATETAIGHERVRQEAAVHRTAAPAGIRTQPSPAGQQRARGAAAEEIVFDLSELDDEPPATVDSPEVHRAWLQRIRELRDAGDLEAARASLHEFRRRHPDQPLPDDLDDLLDE